MTDQRLTREQIARGEFHCHRIVAETLSRQTPFQQIDVLETEGYGRGLFLDGRIQHVAADEYIFSESMVHPAMLLAGTPQLQVLCIGCGPGGVIRELLKHHSVRAVVQVEIDPTIIEISRAYFPHISERSQDDPRYELVIADALAYLETSSRCFDLIINDLSEPLAESPAAKLFWAAGLEQIKARLSPQHGMYVTWAGSVGPQS